MGLNFTFLKETLQCMKPSPGSFREEDTFNLFIYDFEFVLRGCTSNHCNFLFYRRPDMLQSSWQDKFCIYIYILTGA